MSFSKRKRQSSGQPSGQPSLEEAAPSLQIRSAGLLPRRLFAAALLVPICLLLAGHCHYSSFDDDDDRFDDDDSFIDDDDSATRRRRLGARVNASRLESYQAIMREGALDLHPIARLEGIDGIWLFAGKGPASNSPNNAQDAVFELFTQLVYEDNRELIGLELGELRWEGLRRDGDWTIARQAQWQNERSIGWIDFYFDGAGRLRQIDNKTRIR